MSDSKNEILIDSYVQLKGEFADTDFYRGVSAGSTGWVKDRKVDDGFPMIFITWDEGHPNYAGERDKWVFESHFEVLHDGGSTAEEYIDAIRKATDLALSGEAFMMFSLNKKTDDEKDYYKVSVVGEYFDIEKMNMIEAEIISVASSIFDEYVAEQLEELYNEKENKDEDESGR
jgi:hypothetical protein